ncbi:MAG: SDR family oxidoreductase, partial [Myxococcales bacterium]|nr:SDR family oxidoreductase [Myxococcales bacterium]
QALPQDHLTTLALDVADPGSVSAFAGSLKGRPIDVLINNAGVFGKAPQDLGSVDYDSWASVLATNTMGPLRMLEGLLPNLREGQEKKVVTITSGMGSIGDNGSGGYYLYRSSKTAVNMVMRSAAIDLTPEGFTVFVINPGWVQTDMGGSGAKITPDQSAEGILRVTDDATPSQGGAFLNYDGGKYPW